MAKYIIDGSTLTDIANAIREKKGMTGTTGTIECQEFATEIRNISTGGGDAGLGTLVGATYYIEGFDSSAFYLNADPSWEGGDYIYLEAGDKACLVQVAENWGGGEYPVTPNVCTDSSWTELMRAGAVSVRKFEFTASSTGGYAATAYIEYHDGSIFNGGPGLSTVPFVAGVTKWSDISSIASEGAEDAPTSGGPYNCVYVYLHGLNWHLLNVSPDDLVQAKTYYAIGA